MKHWWEPIYRLDPNAGRLIGPQINASRVLFNEAKARGGVVEMHHEVKSEPKDEPCPE